MHASPKRRNADDIRKNFKRSGGHGYTLTTLDWRLRISRDAKYETSLRAGMQEYIAHPAPALKIRKGRTQG